MNIVINRSLVAEIKSGFVLNWNGVHGASHWTRVRNNGIKLARRTGANTTVVEYFAFIHDCRRLRDGTDALHGQRASEFAREQFGKTIHLTDAEFSELTAACDGHSDGLTSHPSMTVMTCWDADRLDLGRVGICPTPAYLCTDYAKTDEMIQWAYGNSRA